MSGKRVRAADVSGGQSAVSHTHQPVTTPEPTPDQGVDLDSIKHWHKRRHAGEHHAGAECHIQLMIREIDRLRAEIALKDEVIRAARRVDGCFWAFADTAVHQDEMGCLPALDSALDRLDADPGSPAESSQ